MTGLVGSTHLSFAIRLEIVGKPKLQSGGEGILASKAGIWWANSLNSKTWSKPEWLDHASKLGDMMGKLSKRDFLSTVAIYSKPVRSQSK